MYVSVCVFQGVCKGMRASNEHRYESVPTQTLEPQASAAKYAIKNFTLEHANYGAELGNSQQQMALACVLPWQYLFIFL